MSRLFYATLDVNKRNPVFILGDKSAYALSKVLAEEAVKDGKLALILSVCERTYPIEGKVLVSPETELLMELFKEENPEVMYLAKAVKNDLLQPYSMEQILTLLPELKAPVQAFVMITPEKKKELERFTAFEHARFICTMHFASLEEELFSLMKKTAVSDNQMIQKIGSIFNTYCPLLELPVEVEHRIVFIDRVKNILDENKLLSLFRKFRETFPGQIYIGDILNYQLKKV